MTAVPSSSPPPVPERIEALDGLRGLAILLVVVMHALYIAPLLGVDLAGAYARATLLGWVGVDVFFVLSGFLITGILVRSKDAPHYFRNFYARRVLRIFPLYYAVLLLQTVGLAVFKSGSAMADGFFSVLPWYATYLTNWAPVHEDLFAHAWSLAVEEQFYLVWPPLLVLLGVRAGPVFLVAFLAGTQMLDFGVFGPDSIELARRLAPFSAIALGVLLGIALHVRAGFTAMHAACRHRPFVLLPAAALAGLVFVPGDIGGWPRLAIHVSMTVLVAAVVVNERHWGSALCRWRPVAHIGVVSYGMYLLHQLCLIPTEKVLARLGTTDVVPFFVCGSAVTVLVATISYRTLERYFLGLKKRWERRPPVRSAAAPPGGFDGEAAAQSR